MKRNKLRALRVLYDLNQEEMAIRCGVTRCVYSLIEQGKRKGTSEFWVKLKNEFNLTADEAWRIEYESLFKSKE